jgi:hypothetical protein
MMAINTLSALGRIAKGLLNVNGHGVESARTRFINSLLDIALDGGTDG